MSELEAGNARAPGAQHFGRSRPPSLLSVREGYRRWAPVYDEFPNPLLALEQRAVLPFLAEVRGRRVLDLGCGTGRWSRLLAAKQPAALVAVDISDAMLRKANEKRVPNQFLVQADCLELPLADHSFDLAICSFAIGHLSTLSSMARECARVLRGGARLYISDLHPAAYRAGWRTSFRDPYGRAEIATVGRSLSEMIQPFSEAGLNCRAIDEFSLGPEERRIFRSAGKDGYFREASRIPAVVVCQFIV
ncbi:MAG: class I SAM-dependent methyltransferase [Acidobacteria bacterium]|nr:class I SAM-dependent methyltransferase [Acidobacteriota bacterium]